jgi:hypothetical protein
LDGTEMGSRMDNEGLVSWLDETGLGLSLDMTSLTTMSLIIRLDIRLRNDGADAIKATMELHGFGLVYRLDISR